jgi:hypothetical protein
VAHLPESQRLFTRLRSGSRFMGAKTNRFGGEAFGRWADLPITSIPEDI